jgi:hypothetical protein
MRVNKKVKGFREAEKKKIIAMGYNLNCNKLKSKKKDSKVMIIMTQISICLQTLLK